MDTTLDAAPPTGGPLARRSSRPARLAVGAALLGVALLAAGWIGAFTGEQPGAAPAGAAGTSSDPPRSVTGVGIGRVAGVPDTLVLTLGVTSRAPSAGAALSRNSAAVRNVIQTVLDAGVDRSDIQTSNLSISPITDERGATVTAYVVDNRLTVRMHDFDRAGALVDEVTGAAGDDVVVQGLWFSVEDDDELMAAARSAAVKRARTQAEQLADAAGVELGPILEIREGAISSSPFYASERLAAAGDAAAPIEPGTEDLQVQVTIVFAIK